MKTLLLGSTGFLGSSLLNMLQQETNLTLLVRQPDISSNHEQIVGDINHPETRSKIMKGGFERVIDCSWEGLPDLTELTNQRNLKAKLSLYRFLVQIGIREINSFGSCLEYGSVKGLVSETTSGIDISDFGKVKIQILNELEGFNLPFRWFRPFYLLGVHQHAESLINTAINSIQFGKDFLPRNPEFSYDYISVEDAARGVVLALNHKQCTGVLNLGSGKSNSVNDVVNLVRKYFGMEETLCATQPAMISDSGKLSRLTGWEPVVSLESEVNRIISSRNKL